MGRCAHCGTTMGDDQRACPVCGGTLLPASVERGLQPLHRPGELLAGRFRVEAILGSGSYGVVYGVLDLPTDRELALKVLWQKAEPGDPALLRLKREIKAAQGAPDPHAIGLYDLVFVQGHPAILMEWVHGETLRDLVKREGALSWDRAVPIVEAVLEAAAQLHAVGIVHRDLKSSNVLLTSDGTAKLGDFGLAKGEPLGATLTDTGVALGTPGYMAPEVIRGGPATPASDLYSLGVLLFEMLSGRMPFTGSSALVVASRQLSEVPPVGLLKEKRVPGWLIRIVSRLLERDPADRFPSARAVSRALEHHAGPWLSRRQRRAISLSALAAALIFAAAWGTLWWRARALPTLAVHGTTVAATDALGRTLFKRTFDMPVQSVCAGRFGPGGSAAVACALSWDGTEDGPTALDSGQRWGNRVYFLNLRGDVLALSRLNQELRADDFAPRFQTQMLTHRFAKGEPERLVLYRHHALWYPAGLNIYQPLQRNGSEGRPASPVVDTLSSSGHLVRPFVFEDLDGDGRDEVAFTAVNNRLYRVYAVGAMKVSPAGATSGLAAFSPDLAPGIQPPMPFYRLISFDHPFPTLRWKARPQTLIVSDQGIPFLELGPGGETRAGTGPSPEQVSALNNWITDLCRLRDLGEWDAMLSSLQSDVRTFPRPYDWLKRFFTSHALMGLGRYDEALATLAAGPAVSDGRQPFMAYRMRLEALFLAGRYRDCLESFLAMKEEARAGWSDLAYPVFWAAVYAEDDALAHSLEPGTSVNSYPVPEAPSLLAGLQGDYRRAEFLARAEHPETSLFPGPGMVLAHVLVMRGKVAEARALLDSVHRRFPGENPDGGETDLWVMWHEKQGGRGLLASMDRVVLQNRRRARVEVEARALLPLTLARAARMHRDAGDLAIAKALQEEAYRLAPKSWRQGLRL